MSFTTICPSCSRKYPNVPESAVGKSARCRACNKTFIVEDEARLDGKDATATEWSQGTIALGADAAPRQGPVSPEWKPGDELLDVYEVKSLLGEGAFGKVWRVFHRGWQVDLAVKSPTPAALEVAGGIENFEIEAETWVNLALHPHTVSCYYVRRIDGLPRVFAEFVRGGDLGEWIDSGELYAGEGVAALEKMLDIAIQFAWGLHHAHEQGLVHQDVKPGNLMVNTEGVAKVTDFGLAQAKQVDMAAEGDASGFVGTVGMTPAYASPEQMMARSLTRRTDLWSWAVSLVQMFAGGISWRRGPQVPQVLETLLAEGPQRPDVPRMPDAVSELLRECLELDPRDRPTDLNAAAERLQVIYHEAIGEPYPRPAPQLGHDAASSLNNRAVSLLDLGKQDEALALWNKALALHPSHPESTYNRGMVRWRAAEITDVDLLGDMERSRMQHERDWLARYLTALVYLECDNCAKAMQWISAARALDPPPEELDLAESEAKKSPGDSAQLLRTLDSQAWFATAVYLSRDGKRALLGTADKTVEFWDVSAGRILRTLQGHVEPVTAVALTADGAVALSGSEDGRLSLWNTATGECIRRLAGHDRAVSAVSISRDGRLALSGSRDATLKLWRLEDGTCVRIFEGHTDAVTSVALTGDARGALSGSRDKTSKLWEVKSGRCVRTFEGHGAAVSSVSFPRRGRNVASGSWDKTVKLWDANTGRCVRTLEGHTRAVTAVSLSADGMNALTASADRTVRFWDTPSARCMRTFQAHRQPVSSLARSADGRLALSAETTVLALQDEQEDAEAEEATTESSESSESKDTRVVLWSTAPRDRLSPMVISRINTSEALIEARRQCARELSAAEKALAESNPIEAVKRIRAARSLPDHEREARSAHMWADLYRFAPQTALLAMWKMIMFRGHEGPVRSVSLSPDSRLASSGGQDGTVRVWDTRSGQCLRTLEGHEGPVTAVAIPAGGRHVLSASEDATFKVWDLKSAECVQTLGTRGAKKTAITCFAHDDARNLVLVGGQDGSLKVWDLERRNELKKLASHGSPLTALCLSRDGSLALTGHEDRTIKWWDMKTGNCLKTMGAIGGHKHTVTALALRNDAREALSGGDDGLIIVWGLEKGLRMKAIEAHTGAVRALAIDPLARFVVSTGQDNLVRFWDLKTRQCLQTSEAQDKRLLSLAMSPEKGYLLSGGADGLCALWLLDWKLDIAPMANEWDSRADVYLEAFLEEHSRRPETTLRRGRRDATEPHWSQAAFATLMDTLAFADCGWISQEAVRERLKSMQQPDEPENVSPLGRVKGWFDKTGLFGD